jgi:predicted deacylase
MVAERLSTALGNGDGWTGGRKDADPRPELPHAGQRVRVGLEIVNTGTTAEQHSASLADAGAYRAVAAAQQPPAVTPETPASGPVDRDSRIMRQAVLHTSVNVLASAGQVAEQQRAAQERIARR